MKLLQSVNSACLCLSVYLMSNQIITERDVLPFLENDCGNVHDVSCAESPLWFNIASVCASITSHSVPLPVPLHAYAAHMDACAGVCVHQGGSHHPYFVLCLCLQRVSSGLHKNRAKIEVERREEEERALLARTQPERACRARHKHYYYHTCTGISASIWNYRPFCVFL